ncbi:conserved hypothetical protein [Gammaproteobacteria bacterium]
MITIQCSPGAEMQILPGIPCWSNRMAATPTTYIYSQTIPMTKTEWIAALGLQPHIEGGYFRRTYQSENRIRIDHRHNRHLLTSIFYLLTDDSPVGYFHKNTSDIIHYYHAGAPLTYWIIPPDGNLYTYQLGPEVANGQKLQLLVEGGCWKATILERGEYSLLSEAVAPGFDYRDMEIATATVMQQKFPRLWPQIALYVKES